MGSFGRRKGKGGKCTCSVIISKLKKKSFKEMRSRWAISSARFKKEEEEKDVRRDKEGNIDRDPDKRGRLPNGTEELTVRIASPRNAAEITPPSRPHRRESLWSG